MLQEYSKADSVINKLFIANIPSNYREKTSLIFIMAIELARQGVRNEYIAQETLKKAMSIMETDSEKLHLHILGKLLSDFKKQRAETIAEELRNTKNIVYFNDDFQKYSLQKGCYISITEEEFILELKGIAGLPLSLRELKEIMENHKIICKIDNFQINNHRILGLINCKNSMLEVKENEIIVHPLSPEYYSTCCVGVSYVKDSECPRWLDFLSETFDHYKAEKDKAILLLQEMMGYMLVPGNKYQKMFYFWGKSRSGKSVIGHIISKMLGDENVSSIPFENIGDERKIAELSSKLLNLSGELSRGVKIQSASIKSLVGEDKILGRKIYGSPFYFVNLAKLLVIGNSFATFDDNSGAILERLILLTFETQVPEEKRNANLKNILESELEGIFRWALHGLITLSKRGRFDEPARNSEAKESIEKKADSVYHWILETALGDFIKDNDQIVKIPFKKFYDNYKIWCKDSCIEIEKRDEFKLRLTQFDDIKVYRDTSKNQDYIEISINSLS